MSKENKLIQKFFLVTAPVLAISALGISPTRAATFASSSSRLDFQNFSQAPSTINNFSDANTGVFEKGGVIEATAIANAVFSESLISAEPEINLSEVFGENQAYLGFAESLSQNIGNFDIEAGTSFSFDFQADLELETSIDNPSSENATASGDISFLLVNTDDNSIFDFFDIAGNLTTEGDSDFIGLRESDNVKLNQPSINSDFDGLEESLQVSVSGSFKRTFANPTNLALIEFQRNRVLAKAPEPSTSLALLLSTGVIGIIIKRRR
ncbi:hypothetical protein NIES267_63830 [Calothrix parasitica NIES-267]|uniref:PEP-CTERM protein-sorting domain-containing protein n=1 Tax=Calothrix parasitica NIES-267 TaxID=1973488 RepID=A0A1Z4M067_9CYAN|nr:hypothetical protein NIES267_63830 [Calothrix parasitica NIES-267]